MATYKCGKNYAKVLKAEKGYKVVRGNPMNETVSRFPTKRESETFAKKWIRECRKKQQR